MGQSTHRRISVAAALLLLLVFANLQTVTQYLGSSGLVRARPQPTSLSADEGCVLFCDPGAAACPRYEAASGAPDACIVRNVVLRDRAAALEFAAPRAGPLRDAGAAGPPRAPPGPLRFVDAAHVLVPPRCIVRGTTVLVTNYQQHIPHFAEGLFFALSGLLAGDGGLLCEAGRPCQLLFHQLEIWPERAGIAWHEGALVAAEATAPLHAPTALNVDLFNVVGASRSAELAPGCTAGALKFERLAVLHARVGRRWFSGPRACAAFRGAALQQHVPAARGAGALQRGAIALLVRRGSRSISNSDAVEAAMRARFGAPVRLVSFEGLSFGDQVRALHDVRLLVAPHGAGLANLVFLPRGAALIEVFPIFWRPAQYFDALADTCGMWYRAYENHDGAAAELSAPCREAFGERLPPGEECSSQQRCVECGKQSATRVDIARIDALLAEAQAHLASALEL